MRSVAFIVGIILIIVGIFELGYQGVTYTSRDKVAQIGNMTLTAEQEKTIVFPPYLGGISLAAGIVLVIIARAKK